METRLLVERFAIEKVVRLGVDLHDDLDAAIIRQQALSGPEYSPEFVEADREFHRLFVAAAGNEILLQLHDSLRDRQSRMGLVALTRSAERTREILAEHRALTAAVGAGDVEDALSILDRHLQGTLALLRGGTGETGWRS